MNKETEDNGLSKAFLALAKRAAYQTLEDIYKTLEEYGVTPCESEQPVTKEDYREDLNQKLNNL